ncbi:MAG: hypothetical protein V1685_06710 [Parcubacteria group bacterium]
MFSFATLKITIKRFREQRGYQLILVIVLLFVVGTMGLALSKLLVQQILLNRRQARAEQTYHIAEAGIHYYRWHLAHDPDDFTDGTGGPGPYVHEYTDIDGNVVGTFTLQITPPVLGSTIVAVQSTGQVTVGNIPPRTIEARLGIQSVGQYAVVADDVMRFGEGTEVFGPIHSNKGIRFDGIAYGQVTSTCDTYNDPDHTGPNESCVHTHQPNPSTVFLGGTATGVAPITFSSFTSDLSDLRTLSQNGGVYLGGSGAQGYLLRFRTDDKVDMYIVNSQQRCQYRLYGQPWRDYSNIWSYNTTSAFQYLGTSSVGVNLPANGVIFVQDDVWVEGQINGARVTVVAARNPLTTGNATIVVNNDLRYTSNDGSDSIGLIAQTDISVGFYSENDLIIDASVIARSGRVGRYYYEDYTNAPDNLPTNRFNPVGCGSRLDQSPAGYVHRSVVTLTGSIITAQRYGFAYTDGTGYGIRNLIWDNNVLFSPPPNFPTIGEYTIMGWDESN